MARTGRFGRLPRQAPDLSSAIAALLRESQNQYDANMVDAWKNGGTVDGKGVSDSRLLAHFRKRMEGLAKDDPLYDEWQNRYTQYNFSIEESKMALKNDQGKISNAQMAQFYRNWANKPEVQKNSEFYRSLLSRAAKWQAAATARKSGGSARAKAEAHAKWADGYYKNNVEAGRTAQTWLLEVAKMQGAAPPNADSLDDIDQNSVAYTKFLDAIDNGKVDDPNIQGVLDQLTKKIRETNPNWTWSMSNLNDLFDRSDSGLKRLINESTTKTERKQWTDVKGEMQWGTARINQTPANKRVQLAADQLALDLDQAQGDPYAARAAMQKFHDALDKEVKNIVAGKGKQTVDTQDILTASSLITTLNQTKTILAGGEVQPPAAKAAAGGERGGVPEGYTVFDAAAGNGSPNGWLALTGNAINRDTKLLDAGGWIMTTPQVGSGGAPVLDGNGDPMFESHIFGANVPQPPGAIGVTGTMLTTDHTRTATGPEGPTPVTVTPTVYVNPSPPNIALVGPSGESVNPDTVPGGVKFTINGAEVAAPWVELRGVPGPDGKAVTMYRTGDGTAASPYLFHDHPPTPVDTKTTPSGQPIVHITPGVDDKGNAFGNADMADVIRARDLMRTTVRPKTADDPNPPYVLGTYNSTGATGVAIAVAHAYSTGSKTADADSNKWLRDYQRGVEGLPLYKDGKPNPDRVAGEADYKELSQTVGLYKSGKAGSSLNEAYSDMNQTPVRSQGYIDTLARNGFTVAKYGQDEVNRRASMLQGVDDAEQRLETQFGFGARLGRGLAPQVGLGLGAAFGGQGPQGANTYGQQQSDLEAARRNIFNPNISVSNITIPGMPPMMQPGQRFQPGDLLTAAYTGNTKGLVGPKPYSPPIAPRQGPPAPSTVPGAPGSPVAGPPVPKPSTPPPPQEPLPPNPYQVPDVEAVKPYKPPVARPGTAPKPF